MNTIEFLKVNEALINNAFEVAIVVGLFVVGLFVYDLYNLNKAKKGSKTNKKEKLNDFLIF